MSGRNSACQAVRAGDRDAGGLGQADRGRRLGDKLLADADIFGIGAALPTTAIRHEHHAVAGGEAGDIAANRLDDAGAVEAGRPARFIGRVEIDEIALHLLPVGRIDARRRRSSPAGRQAQTRAWEARRGGLARRAEAIHHIGAHQPSPGLAKRRR